MLSIIDGQREAHKSDELCSLSRREVQGRPRAWSTVVTGGGRTGAPGSPGRQDPQERSALVGAEERGGQDGSAQRQEGTALQGALFPAEDADVQTRI